MNIQWTNENGYPEYIVEWLKRDEYDHNNDERTISATELEKPIRALLLARRAETVVLDVENRIASRLGTAIHNSIDESQPDGERGEERWNAELNGWTISGKFDLLRDGMLRDIKTTSVWKYIKPDNEKYIKQLSVYRWILAQNGEETQNVGEICFIFTDWSSKQAKRGNGYPKSRIQAIRIPLMPLNATEDYIAERLERIEKAEKARALPECSDEELWKQPDVWALMKKGRKSAVKLYYDPVEADKACVNAGAGHFIEERKGVVKRCHYCDVRSVCMQAKDMSQKGLLEG